MLEKNKPIERSVDSIAKVYAVVIGLALAESVKTLLVKDAAGNVDFRPQTLWSATPAFIALVFTLVPFWHGMNRHLDRSYLEKEGVVAEGALLMDFAVFFIESGLFLVAAWTLREGLVTFYCIGGVLIIDVPWGFISHQIHSPHDEKSHAVGWAVVNIAAIALAVGVLTFRFDPKAPALMVIAVVRTIADYWRGWDFYFPALQASVASVSTQ